MIKTSNLKKIFKSGDNVTVALGGVSIEVNQGEFVTIAGRSGSGKSTLLYQLGLLDIPSEGTIEMLGQDIALMSHEDRAMTRLNDLGYIFQDYAILPSLTALENTMLPLIMQGYDFKQAEIKSIKSLEKVALGHRLNNIPAQLSGGEQQRVAIARAIAHDPKIIFADEPTANLDTETSEQVMKTFLDLNKEGQTIVMVTHEPEYAKLADRTIFLKDGVVVDVVKNK